MGGWGGGAHAKVPELALLRPHQVTIWWAGKWRNGLDRLPLTACKTVAPKANVSWTCNLWPSSHWLGPAARLHRAHSHIQATRGRGRLTSLKGRPQTKVLHSSFALDQHCSLVALEKKSAALGVFSRAEAGWQLPGEHADAAAALGGWRPTGSSPRAAASGWIRWAHGARLGLQACSLQERPAEREGKRTSLNLGLPSPLCRRLL